MQPDVRVLALPCIDPTFGRVDLRILPGTSIADMVAQSLPRVSGTDRARLRVTINGNVILPDVWHAVRPKPGTQVLIRVVPQGDILRNVLFIALTVAAVAAGQFYATELLSALSIGASTAATAVASAAITSTVLVAGTLLVNALIPARSDKKDAPTYAIQSLQNQVTPDGVIPFILGKVRYAPVFAGLPYTEAVGDDRYIRALFTFGYGPLHLTNFRIGDTPVEKFQDFQIEVREGYPTDLPVTLYPRQVVEKALSVELKASYIGSGPQTRFTAADATDCSIDITFPGGLGGVNKDGNKVGVGVDIGVRYRKVGTTTWTVGSNLSIYAKLSGKPFTRTFPLTFAERARYEIELTRITGDYDNPEVDQSKKEIQRTGRSVWSALRTFRPEYPINFDKPLAVAAVRIRATGQLNGTLDELNADVEGICPDWDAATSTYITRTTRNPSSLFRYVLSGPGITYPLAPDEIDALQDWHAFCLANGLQYNRVHDYEASVLDVLSDIAAAGRASPQYKGNRWSVVVDRALDTITAHITPRNSWGFQGETAYSKFPDAFRVSFSDETNNYARVERIVPWPGFSGDPKVFEKLDLPGITNPDQIWKETRKRQYELIHRRHSYTVNQDFESLVLTRGDLAVLSHDVLDRSQVAARVRLVADGKVGLDEPVTMEAGKTYACRFRRADGSSLIRTVQTVPGVSTTLTLTGSGDVPARDDLAMFGESSRETLSCTVKGVEAMENFTARLSLVDHAPQIEALVAADVPPAWSGRAGAPVVQPIDIPVAPLILDVASGRLAADAVTPTIPYPVVVQLQANPSGTTPLATFEVQSRKAGITAWTSVSAAAGAGRVLLSAYTKADQIEIQARGISTRGTPGDWTASVFHTVAATDATTPVSLLAVIERRPVSGTTNVTRIRLTCAVPARDDLALVGRYRAVGTTVWTAMRQDTTSVASVVSGDLNDGISYEVQGALSTASGADISDYIAASGSPITAVADPVAPAAPSYTSAALTATTVNHAVKQSPSTNARSVQLLRTLGFGKAFSAAGLSVSEALYPNQADALSDTILLGYNTWWLAAQNGSGVSSIPTDPRSILYVDQPGRLNGFPNDLSNAEWVKSGVSVGAGGGTGPDGLTATYLPETAVNQGHFLTYTASGLTSGNKYRAVWGVKAAGRNNGRLEFSSSSPAGVARLLFDLTAGTVTMSTNTGGIFTAVTGSIERVSADYYLIIFTATCATTAFVSRLYYGDPSASFSYAGDTTKGMNLWACSFAPVA